MSRARDDRRALLESIAFGADPSIKPGDRLRALELLDGLAVGDDEIDFHSDLANLSGEQLDRELDAALGPAAVADALGEGTRFPVMAGLIRAAVEDRARELADRDAIDHEIEERARALAGTIYVEQGLEEAERAANLEGERTRREKPPSSDEGIDPGLASGSSSTT
jgi:hypothetical protein